MSLKLVLREEWGAMPAKRVKPLTHPAPYVCLSYNNKVDSHSPQLIRDLQKSHMDEIGMYDIQSNFLVTLDGTVYEGRGWNARPAKLFKQYEKYNGQFVDITLLGKFKENPKSESPQLKAVLDLINHGKQKAFLSQWYEMLWPDGGREENPGEADL